MAQARQDSPGAPFGRGWRQPAGLLELTQLGQHPVGLAQQQGIDLGQRRPVRGAHAQALRPDAQADGTARGALELVGHQLLAKTALAVGARVPAAHRAAGG